jgi:hypothetical protein
MNILGVSPQREDSRAGKQKEWYREILDCLRAKNIKIQIIFSRIAISKSHVTRISSPDAPRFFRRSEHKIRTMWFLKVITSEQQHTKI